MDSHLKMRISRMFRSSLVSCRSNKNVSDVIQNPVFMPHEQSRRDYNYNVVFEDSLPSMVSSVCKPKCSTKLIQKDHHDPAHRHQRKVSDRGVLYVVTGDTDDGRVCPPTSPTSTPLTTAAAKSSKKKKKKPKTKKKERSSYRLLLSSSGGDNSDQSSGWFSSEDDRDQSRDRDEAAEKCFLSSNSVSTSDSSEQYYTRKKKKKKKSSGGSGRMGRRRANDCSLNGNKFEGCGSSVKGKVEESFAVVKRSSDPKGDFRNSMVEMIVEKQLFGAKDLEELLQCFLYLNPAYHHGVIVEVFWEIWEALFVL